MCSQTNYVYGISQRQGNNQMCLATSLHKWGMHKIWEVVTHRVKMVTLQLELHLGKEEVAGSQIRRVPIVLKTCMFSRRCEGVHYHDGAPKC